MTGNPTSSETPPNAVPPPAPPGPAGGPLGNVRVIDLSRVLAGNMLTLQLADLGADVLKVESPRGGDALRQWTVEDIPLWWKVYSRNKRSVALELRDPRGMSLLWRLLETAQVLVENFRPGTLEAMGLAPQRLLECFPRLVIVRISGWGQTGPYRLRPGFGTLVEAYSGLAIKTGYDDRPPVLPSTAMADMLAGLYGFGAVLAALRVAEAEGGRGQVIDLSLFDAMFSCIGPDVAQFQLTGKLPARTGSRSPSTAPRNVYQTADGQWIALSAATQAMTERMFHAIGRPELIDDARFSSNATRLQHVEALDAIIQDYVGGRALPELLQHFERLSVTAGPVLDAAQILSDRFVQEHGSLIQLGDADCGALPMHDVVPRLSLTPGAVRRAAPALGADTGEVLRALGLAAHEIDRLAAEGVVRAAAGTNPPCEGGQP